MPGKTAVADFRQRWSELYKYDEGDEPLLAMDSIHSATFLYEDVPKHYYDLDAAAFREEVRRIYQLYRRLKPVG